MEQTARWTTQITKAGFAPNPPVGGHTAQWTSSRRSSSSRSERIETRLRVAVLGLDTTLRATRPAHSTSRLS